MFDEGSESAIHKAAKLVMAEWLIESAHHDCGDLGQLYWRHNRAGIRPYGVWVEYPFVDGESAGWPNQVWDEFYLDGEGVEFDPRWKTRPPSFDELTDLGLKPVCFADIALQHKGQIITAIEIVHSHPTPTWKLDYYESLDLRFVEIDAAWIMAQSRRPKWLEFVRHNLHEFEMTQRA